MHLICEENNPSDLSLRSGYFFAKWQIVAAIQFSAARFAISAFCPVVNLAYDSLLDSVQAAVPCPAGRATLLH